LIFTDHEVGDKGHTADHNLIATRLNRSVVVTDYGAVGDGAVDDTAAVNDAIALLPFGGVVYFPAGNYRITGPIALPWRVSLVGQGKFVSTLISEIDPIIQIDGGEQYLGFLRVSHLTLDGGGITVTRSSQFNLSDLMIVNADNAILIDGGVWNCSFNRLTVQSCVNAIWIDTSISQVNALRFRDCVIAGNSSAGVRSIGGVNILFDGCDISNNGANGIHQTNGGRSLSIRNCYLERNTGVNIVIEGQRAPLISGCYFYGGADTGTESDYAISLKGTNSALVQSCQEWAHNVGFVKSDNDIGTVYQANDNTGDIV